MPQFSREKKIDLRSALGKKKSKSEDDLAIDEEEGQASGRSTSRPASASAPKQGSRIKPAQNIFDDSEDEEEDEIIAESKKDKAGIKAFFTPQTLALCAVPLALAIVFIFVMRVRESKQTVQDPNVVQTQTVSAEPTHTQAPEPTLGVGLQDFTGNTNNMSDSPPEDPAGFTHDLYGLTTQVNYEVASIKEAADFVNYKKHRGVWDSGLELYWLEATYREKQYVIQVPFKYYKELDDVGIVPVKMEVLQIKLETDGSLATVISYMSLDEATLKSIMKSQSK